MALIPKGYRSHYAQTPRFPDIPLSVRQFGEALMLLWCQIGFSEPCFVGGEEGSVVDSPVLRE